MMTWTRWMNTTALSILMMALPAVGYTQAADDKKLEGYSCKDVMRFSGTDRDVAIALHGYFMGKKGTTTFNTDKLSATTDRFVDSCLDNPTAKALDTMAKESK